MLARRQRTLWFIGLILAATAVRLPALFANTFQADEALFASWARLIAVWDDPLLQSQLVDKPPLLFYSQALFYPLFGPVEWAARLPNFIASLLLIPLTGRLAWCLFQDQLTTILAAGFVAFSPLAIQFSATAFTDPLLTALLIAALAAAATPASPHPRTLPAGLLFGLALAAKYQALLFLPLLLGITLINGWRRAAWRRWLVGFGLVLAVVVAWELARSGHFTLWESQLSAFGGVRLTRSWELWPRLSGWGELWQYLLGSELLGFGILLTLPLFLGILINDQERPTLLDQLVVIYLVGYFFLHWFLAIPVWDRYVLPAVPLAGLVLGRFVARLLAFARPALPPPVQAHLTPARLMAGAMLALLLVQLPAVAAARNGRLPVGGQAEADDGAAEIARLLADAPYGTVLYDHWYSWQWRYHLFEKRVYISWFPHPDALVADLAVFGQNEQPRYLVLPAGPAAQPVIRAVETAGFILEPVVTDRETTMQLYRIRPGKTRLKLN